MYLQCIQGSVGETYPLTLRLFAFETRIFSILFFPKASKGFPETCCAYSCISASFLSAGSPIELFVLFRIGTSIKESRSGSFHFLNALFPASRAFLLIGGVSLEEGDFKFASAGSGGNPSPTCGVAIRDLLYYLGTNRGFVLQCFLTHLELLDKHSLLPNLLTRLR